PNTDMRQNTINTMTDMAQLANVQHGAYSIGNLAMDETFNHMSVQNRSLEYSGTPKYKLRNTAMDGDTYKMNTIPVGRVRDVLPSRTVGRVIAEDSKYNRYDREDNYYREYRRDYNYYTPSHRSYSIPKHSYQYTTAIEEPDKMIWATYIHSKEKINGMQVGHLKQDSTIKQNGAVVGADLWKNDNNFGGIAITYAKGDVNSTQQVSSVKNDVDHYGASIYHRQDMGKFSVQLDAGYGKSNNDIKMETIGAENVTLKPKTEAYSAGIKIEEPLELNDKTLLVPFLGVRYTFMKTQKADSNLDITYGGNEQNMCSIPVGLSLRSQYEVSDSMKLGTTLEAGYAFNVGDRKGTQKLLYGGVTDSISYNIVDKGQYFIKAAIQAICENMIWELGYHYAKSSKVKDDKWYVNANFDF
ncbi:MAG: autotransporter outer membrane beta-barrel domain-containing protein, partial [Phascolarctobacterium sp.]|nr:autotransporter outer membrane beta-barrel domain-containing protein [Candidatus Phascolarctobacterium caballi]